MDTDVLIVGAGPVGLMLACELQRRGVSHRLVEQRSQRDYFCKALGVSPRTLEVFDLMGLVDEAVSRGVWFSALTTMVNGQTVSRVEVQKSSWPYGPIGLAQYETEDLLEGFLREHGGRVEFGVTFEGLQQGPDGVRCSLGAHGSLTARYLVGCDGAHSQVRKEVGLSFEGGRYDKVFLLGDVELEWEHPHSEVCKLVHTVDGQMRNLLVVVPVPGNPRRYRLSTAAPPEYWEEGAVLPEHPSLELIQSVVRDILPPGTSLSNLRWSSMYRISHRLASRYREQRVFLAGDAAHIHPPIGGLGMNTGLQDAFNLGWKLARVIGAGASQGLLDSYHEERHRAGEEVVNLTARRMDQAVANQPTSAEREAAEEEANSQFFVHYRGLSLAGGAVPAGDQGPEPGDRMAYIDGLVRPNLRRRARLVDFLRSGRLVLLGYGGSFADLAQQARARLGDWVRVYQVGDSSDAEDIPLLLDSQGEVAENLGPGPGAVLIRPDGYVGWRGRTAPELEAYLSRL